MLLLNPSPTLAVHIILFFIIIIIYYLVLLFIYLLIKVIFIILLLNFYLLDSKFGFTLIHNHVTYPLYFDSVRARDDWMETITKAAADIERNTSTLRSTLIFIYLLFLSSTNLFVKK